MTVSQATRETVRQQAGNRCGYCLSHQRYVLGLLEIEHIIPQSKGGTDDIDNLWLSCRPCNGYKGVKTEAIDLLTDALVPLFNPRHQLWDEHFVWDELGEKIVGMSEIGRATIIALKLNNPIAVTVRKAWVSAGWHPPMQNTPHSA